MFVKSSGEGISRSAGFGVCSLIVDSVMSVNGVPCRDMGSGDSDGCGVGSGGWSSGASAAIEMRETRLLRAVLAAAALRRLGGDFFVGDNGSSTTLSGGLKICEGSADSIARVCRRAAVLLFGVVASPTVLRLGDRTFFAGAGVNSSSSSSSLVWSIMLFSTSELPSSCTTGRRRAAARRVGRSGDAVDISPVSNRVVSAATVLRDPLEKNAQMLLTMFTLYNNLPNRA